MGRTGHHEDCSFSSTDTIIPLPIKNKKKKGK